MKTRIRLPRITALALSFILALGVIAGPATPSAYAADNTIVLDITDGLQQAAEDWVNAEAGRGLQMLTHVKLTNGVMTTADRDYLKASLTKLTALDLSEHNPAQLAAGLLEGCTTLGVVTLPTGAVLPNRLFFGCTALTSVGNLSTAGLTPGSSVFEGCTALAEVTLPVGMVISERMFAGCTKLITVANMDKADKALGTAAFAGCTALRTVALPNNAVIAESLFEGCTNLTDVLGLVAADPSIGTSAFANCTSLKAVTLRTGTVLGDHAFDGCVRLESVNFTAISAYGAASLARCAFDFSTVIPASMGSNAAAIAPDQLPRAYLRAVGSTDLGTVALNAEFKTLPGYQIKTHANNDYKKLVTERATHSAWLNQSIADITASLTVTRDGVGYSSSSIDTSAACQYVFIYTLPSGVNADAQTISYTLNVDKNPTITDGWHQDQNGDWVLYIGGKKQTGWVTFEGKTYYLNQNGVRATGWLKLGSTWYYLERDGVRATGWLYLNGQWFFMRSNGAMATGWLDHYGTWYYLKSDGAMATGWLQQGYTWYYLYPDSGAMATGWLRWSGAWYYLHTQYGMMVTGWQYLGNKWYYLKPNGSMAEGWLYWKYDWYYLLDTSGQMATGWLDWRGDRYYLFPGGNMAVGSQYIGGTWYFFNTSGQMLRI